MVLSSSVITERPQFHSIPQTRMTSTYHSNATIACQVANLQVIIIKLINIITANYLISLQPPPGTDRMPRKRGAVGPTYQQVPIETPKIKKGRKQNVFHHIMHVRNRNRAKQSTASSVFSWPRGQADVHRHGWRSAAAAPEIHDELPHQRLEHGGLDLGADVAALGPHVCGA